mmetsp:Transcript_29585/g.45725  ORF Transcript_29585/g.45725 Transcript_29585/m.45725 type:complete len:212 (-) Transcript_29585:51-686(-)
MKPRFDMQVHTSEAKETFENNRNLSMDKPNSCLDNPQVDHDVSYLDDEHHTARRNQSDEIAVSNVGVSKNGSVASRVHQEELAISETLRTPGVVEDHEDENFMGGNRDGLRIPLIVESINKGNTASREDIEYIQARINVRNDANQMRLWLVLLNSMKMNFDVLKATGVGITVLHLRENLRFHSLEPLLQAILMHWIGLLPKSVRESIQSKE